MNKLKKEKSSFIGKGVIVGKYLVTTTQIAPLEDRDNNLSTLYYSQMSIIHYLDVEYKQVAEKIYDGRKNIDENGNQNDLLIYRLKESFNSFECNEGLRV